MAAGVDYSTGKQHKMLSLEIKGKSNRKNKLAMTFVTVLLVICSISYPPPHIKTRKESGQKAARTSQESRSALKKL
jgi:hypothetical protein